MRREEVVKAIKIIRKWCLSRDALEHPCDGCPMSRNCEHYADEWIFEGEDEPTTPREIIMFGMRYTCQWKKGMCESCPLRRDCKRLDE